jgi:LysR family transcriptional activator of mexEF-oprN operon
MEPTARALELAASLKPVLESLSDALFAPAGFDPATSQRRFTLGMFDIGEVTLAPVLLSSLAKEGPGMRLTLKPADRHDAGRLLDEGAIDLAIADIGDVAAWHRRRHLFKEHFVCVFDPRRLRAKIPISLDEYLGRPHLLTSFDGSPSGIVDEVLAARGLSRNVILVSTRFATLPFVLGELPAFATLPAITAQVLAAKLRLAVSPLPIAVPEVDIAMSWHARVDGDPAHAWLRQKVERVVMDRAAKVGGRTSAI